MTLFEYVCSQNPVQATALVRDINQGMPRTGKEALQCMMNIMRNGTDQDKRVLLAGVANIHPDKDIIVSDQLTDMTQTIADPMNYASASEKFGVETDKLNACGCNGTKEPEKSISAAGSDSISPIQETEIADFREFKRKMETKSLIIDVLWKTGVIIVILLICYAIYRMRSSNPREISAL